MKKREKKKEETISDYDYFLDDSKMPSAEESKKFVISDELREKMRKSDDELAHELGYY